VLGKTSVDM